MAWRPADMLMSWRSLKCMSRRNGPYLVRRLKKERKYPRCVREKGIPSSKQRLNAAASELARERVKLAISSIYRAHQCAEAALVAESNGGIVTLERNLEKGKPACA